MLLIDIFQIANVFKNIIIDFYLPCPKSINRYIWLLFKSHFGIKMNKCALSLVLFFTVLINIVLGEGETNNKLSKTNGTPYYTFLTSITFQLLFITTAEQILI